MATPAHPCARGMSASMYVIACIEEPWLIRKILGHVQNRNGPAAVTARGPPGHGEDVLGASSWGVESRPDFGRVTVIGPIWAGRVGP